jgi:flagellar basal-body rod protein FlgF
MQSSLYVALSAQVAMEKRLNTIANNVANMNTGGFRADEVKFEEILSLAAKEHVSFASSGQNFVSRRTGPITKTDNPLDVAIQGEAWFAFNGPNGAVYTRDGRFKMNENGDLLTVEGYQVLDAGGAPIALDPMAGSPTISRDGTIMQGTNQVGAIGIFNLRNDSRLSRFGNSGVMSSIPGEVVQDFNSAGVQQGYSEGSNVNPVLEMTKMIAVQRNFDSAATTIQESESTLMDAIRTLGPSS